MNATHRYTLLATIYLVVILPVLYGCQKHDQPLSTWTVTERAGPNGEYTFFACAQVTKNGITQISPIIIWKQSTPPPPITIRWEKGRYTLLRSDTGTVLQRGPGVLFYSGRGQPCQILTMGKGIASVKNPTALRKYVDTMIAKSSLSGD